MPLPTTVVRGFDRLNQQQGFDGLNRQRGFDGLNRQQAGLRRGYSTSQIGGRVAAATKEPGVIETQWSP